MAWLGGVGRICNPGALRWFHESVGLPTTLAQDRDEDLEHSGQRETGSFVTGRNEPPPADASGGSL